MSPRTAKQAGTESVIDSGDDFGPESGDIGTSPYPDNEMRIIAQLEKMPPDARTRLHRVNDRTKEWEPHGILSPAEVNQEWIAEKFGGGTYMVRVLDRNKQGKVIVVASAQWTIPGRYIGPGDRLPGLGGTVAPAPATTAGPPGPGAAMPTRELIDSALASRVMDLLQRDTRPGIDLAGIAAIITAGGALLTPFLERMLAPRPTGDPQMREQLATLARELERMRTAPTPQASAMTDALRAIKQVRDLTTPDVGDVTESKEDKLMGMLPKLLAALTGRPAPDDAPDAARQLPPGEPTIMLPDGTPNWRLIFGNYREQLLGMAAQGWEPGWCADLVERSVPPEMHGLMQEFLRKPEAEAQAIVCDAVPEMRGYATWLPAFLSELRGLMLEQVDDEPEPEPEAKKPGRNK